MEPILQAERTRRIELTKTLVADVRTAVERFNTESNDAGSVVVSDSITEAADQLDLALLLNGLLDK